MYQEMAKDISKQRKRLGGNWAIAQAVFTRAQRDFLCKSIGSDLVFLVLNMTKDCQMNRIKNRHGDSFGEGLLNMLFKYAELCEPAGDDEQNAYNITITEDMNVEDVMKKVLNIVQKL